ncbi:MULTISPECIES: hypothetical protein [Pseudomonas]|uniref:Uncharacterized protein n=1 Tax=Pseudomonas palleroniana TaxID=191390 RepID=A0A109FPH7_9PSED|nr:hypothetical protein [Pseudomonas palleroniana]KWU48068.1 hypothetical protein AWV77_24270 [Pseudomonas palleroniana]
MNNSSVATSTISVAKEVIAEIFVEGEKFKFESNIAITSETGVRLIVRAYHHIFNPFRVHQISFGIPLGTPAGTYPLDGSVNGIVAHYTPPNTPALDSYNAIAGTITLLAPPSLENVQGTFKFKARKFDETKPEIAEIKDGVLNIGSR